MNNSKMPYYHEPQTKSGADQRAREAIRYYGADPATRRVTPALEPNSGGGDALPDGSRPADLELDQQKCERR